MRNTPSGAMTVDWELTDEHLFYEELKTKNLLSKTGTVTGKTVKNVIKGYSFVDETFHPVDGNFDTPFS